MRLQVTGEAEYVDDIAMPPHGLHAGLVLSTKPHARIISIDTSEAEMQAGFEGFFSAKDIPGSNDIGAIIHDEEVFATETVTCVGQVHISVSLKSLKTKVGHSSLRFRSELNIGHFETWRLCPLQFTRFLGQNLLTEHSFLQNLRSEFHTSRSEMQEILPIPNLLT